MIPWLQQGYFQRVRDVEASPGLELYDYLPANRRVLGPNGSYGPLGARATSFVYKRIYGIDLSRFWELWEDGEFYSRLDLYPYWIRDMLAYRWADHNKMCFLHRVFLFRKKIEGLLWDIVYWISDRVDPWFLHDFPREMRHLWRVSHHYHCYSEHRELGRRRVAALEQERAAQRRRTDNPTRLEMERAERRAWMDTIPNPQNPIYREWPEAQA